MRVEMTRGDGAMLLPNMPGVRVTTEQMQGTFEIAWSVAPPVEKVRGRIAQQVLIEAGSDEPAALVIIKAAEAMRAEAFAGFGFQADVDAATKAEHAKVTALIATLQRRRQRLMDDAGQEEHLERAHTLGQWSELGNVLDELKAL